MKLTIKIFVLLATVSLVSCFDDPGTDIVWGDEAFLEIDRAGQPNPTVNILNERKNDGTTYPFSVQINLMGRPQSKDISVNFEIDAASTAIEGVHFTKQSAGNSITIPAGSNTVNLNFTQLADNIESGEKLNLILKLTGGDLPLSKYVRVTYALAITCPSNLAGDYDAHTDWIDDYGDAGSNDYPVTLALVAGQTNRYSLADLSGGMEPIIWSNPPVAVTFNDVCDEIVLHQHSYFYAYFIDAGSSVDPNTGIITINWSNFYGETGTTTLTPQ